MILCWKKLTPQAITQVKNLGPLRVVCTSTTWETENVAELHLL